MTLGTVRFSVEESAFQQLRRVLDMRVARLDRAGAPTARQILGEDETIEIRGVVYPELAGGVGRVQGFRDLAREKKAQLLTDGVGGVWGRFVIERVEEEATHHLRNGVPLRQGFAIHLGAAGED